MSSLISRGQIYNHQPQSSTLTTIKRSILKRSDASASKLPSVVQNYTYSASSQQKLSLGQQFRSTNSVNIVQTDLSARRQCASQPNLVNKLTVGRTSLGASMRKTVKSILVTKSPSGVDVANHKVSNCNSKTETLAKSKSSTLSKQSVNTMLKRPIKSALKTATTSTLNNTSLIATKKKTNDSSIVLNSEGSSDGSSTPVDSSESGECDINQKASNQKPKASILKNSTKSSKGVLNLGQSQEVDSIDSCDSENTFRRAVSTRCSRRFVRPLEKSNTKTTSVQSSTPKKNVTFSTKLTSIL